MVYIFIIIALAVGCLIGYLTAKSSEQQKYTDLKASNDVLKTEKDHLLTTINSERDAHAKQLQQQKMQFMEQLQHDQTQHAAQLQLLNSQHAEQLQREQEHYTEQLQQLRIQHAEQLQRLDTQHAEQLQQQLQLLREQMSTVSEKVLRQRSEQLSEQNQEQLSVILNPLQDGIRLMREAVEKSDREHSATMVRLDATIKTSIEQSREVGERADKLAQALTGENKTQGNFGELRLKQLLVDMGFEEGTQFEEQMTMRDTRGRTIYDEDSHRMVPDVILHFPDERDIIIDSKMSLKAFEEYHNAADDETRAQALQRHIVSVRQHVNELAQKNYSTYIREGRARLDFVLMYVFSESALQLALANDAALWRDAYDKGVIIVGSQNLYTMLRVVEMTWRQVRQVENQENIMKAASTIVDRVQMFYERFLRVEEQLDKTRRAFDEVKVVTASSGQSIETAARRLMKYGVQDNPKRTYKLEDKQEDSLENAIEDNRQRS